MAKRILRLTISCKVLNPTRAKNDFLAELMRRNDLVVRHYIDIISALGLKLDKMTSAQARTLLAELTYPTKNRSAKFDVKAVSLLPSKIYQTARDKALVTCKSFQGHKTKKSKPSPKDNFPVRLDKENFTLSFDQENKTIRFFAAVSTFTKHSLARIPLHIPEESHQYKYLLKVVKGELKVCCAELIQRKGEYYFQIFLAKEIEIIEHFNPNKLTVIGVDLGERNLAVSVALRPGLMLSKGDVAFFGGQKVRANRYHYTKLRAELGHAKKFKKLKSIGQKESRFKRYENHLISKAIAGKAAELKTQGYDVVVVLGRLEGIRSSINRHYSRKLKGRLNSWAFFQLSSFIKYKCEWLGIPVHSISEYNTSKTCHRCGALNRGLGTARQFRCPDCGMTYDRDLNAAMNIAFKGYAFDVSKCSRALPATCRGLWPQTPGALHTNKFPGQRSRDRAAVTPPLTCVRHLNANVIK